MAVVKCFLHVDGKPYPLFVSGAKETADGVHCSYEQLMKALGEDEDLNYLVQGQFEIFDDDFDGYLMLTKSVPIHNKAKLRVTLVKRDVEVNNEVAPENPPVESEPAGSPPSSASLQDQEKKEGNCLGSESIVSSNDILNDQHPSETDLWLDDADAGSILDSDDLSEAPSDSESREEQDLSNDGKDGLEDSNHDREADQGVVSTSKDVMPSNHGESVPGLRSIKTLLAKKSPAFNRAYNDFMNRSQWVKELEEKLLAFLNIEFDRIQTMHANKGKSPDEIWNYVVANLDHPENEDYQLTPVRCKTLFIDRILEYYLDVRIASNCYRESYVLYPNGFAFLDNFLARPPLLRALGVDQRKIELIVAANKGQSKAQVQKLREDYNKWKAQLDKEDQGPKPKEVMCQATLEKATNQGVDTTINKGSEFEQSREKSTSIESILKTKSSEFVQSFRAFMRQGEWERQLEEKMLDCMKSHYGRLIEMHKVDKKTPNQFWDYITSKMQVLHPGNGVKSVKTATCRELFIEHVLEFYMDVYLNSNSYDEACKIYPHGFEMLTKYILKKPLLVSLGVDWPKIVVLIASIDGYGKEFVEELRKEYRKWKKTGRDKDLSATKDLGGRLGLIEQSQISKIPNEVRQIIEQYGSADLKDLMEEIWLRPAEKWRLEKELFTFFTTSINESKFPWIKQRGLEPEYFWRLVADQMQIKMENKSLSMEDCRSAYKGAIDYYFRLICTGIDLQQCFSCYPVVSWAMEQPFQTVRPSMGLGNDRMQVIIALTKGYRDRYIQNKVQKLQLRNQVGVSDRQMPINENQQSCSTFQAVNSSLNRELWKESTSSLSLPSNSTSLRDLFANKDKGFQEMMIKYRNLPTNQFALHLTLLRYLNERRDEIGSKASTKAAWEELWTQIRDHIRSQFPDSTNARTPSACRTIFRRLMMLALHVQINCPKIVERFKIWPCFKLAVSLLDDAVLNKLGVNPQYNWLMKLAHNPSATELSRLMTKDSYIEELSNNFYQFRMDNEDGNSINISESIESNDPARASRPTHSPTFLAEMKALTSNSDDRFINQSLVNLLVNKKREYLSIGSESKIVVYKRPAEIKNYQQFWDKITNTMNDLLQPPRKVDYYKWDRMIILLNTYESIVHNSKSREEAINYWPKCFEAIHENLIDEAFLTKVCQITDLQWVKRLIAAKASFDTLP